MGELDPVGVGGEDGTEHRQRLLELTDGGERDRRPVLDLHVVGQQLGGVAQVVAGMVKDELGFKYHYAIADYLQRSARHIASKTDVDQAYAVGKAAVEMALAGENSVMPAIIRTSDKPYRWKIGKAPLGRVANREKMMPKNYITNDGFGITAACRRYLEPLIKGEDYPPYKNGLPVYVRLKGVPVKRKLKGEFLLS